MVHVISAIRADVVIITDPSVNPKPYVYSNVLDLRADGEWCSFVEPAIAKLQQPERMVHVPVHQIWRIVVK